MKKKSIPSDAKETQLGLRIIAKLMSIDDKLDEILQRLPPTRPREKSAIVASASPRVDPNLGSL